MRVIPTITARITATVTSAIRPAQPTPARTSTVAIAIWAVVGTFALFAGRVRHNVGSETT